MLAHRRPAPVGGGAIVDTMDVGVSTGDVPLDGSQLNPGPLRATTGSAPDTFGWNYNYESGTGQSNDIWRIDTPQDGGNGGAFCLVSATRQLLSAPFDLGATHWAEFECTGGPTGTATGVALNCTDVDNCFVAAFLAGPILRFYSIAGNNQVQPGSWAISPGDWVLMERTASGVTAYLDTGSGYGAAIATDMALRGVDGTLAGFRSNNSVSQTEGGYGNFRCGAGAYIPR